MSRTIIIGDVHGCLDELLLLVATLDVRSYDHLFFAGDLMDRGPDPVGCVQFVRKSGFPCVLGNHEESHLRWRRHEERRAADPSYKNPMRPMTPERQAQNAALTAEDIAWLRDCPYVIEPLPGWILVHGGLFPGKTVKEQLNDKELRGKVLRLRWVDQDGEFVPLAEDNTSFEGPPGSRTWMEAYDGPHNVIYGHAVHSLTTPRIDEWHGVKTYGIDTGCCFGGRLTAMIIEGERIDFVQIQAKKAYVKMRPPRE